MVPGAWRAGVREGIAQWLHGHYGSVTEDAALHRCFSELPTPCWAGWIAAVAFWTVQIPAAGAGRMPTCLKGAQTCDVDLVHTPQP